MEAINKLNDALKHTTNSSVRLKIQEAIDELEHVEKGRDSFHDWMLNKVKSVHYARIDVVKQ